VRRFLADGTPQWAATFAAPSRVAIDSVTSQGWVTSFEGGNVVRLSPSGVALDTITGFQGPIGVAADGRRGRIWIADAYAGRVVALRRDGSVEFTVSNLPEAREIAVDRGTGEAWVTLPGRPSAPGSGAVAVIGPGGAERHRLTGLSEPYGIALDDLQQRSGSPVPGVSPLSERSRPWR
jgi:sugar lactone lactonase YvrE